MAISFDLAAHDKQFHPNGYIEGKSKCTLRDRIKDFESVDDLSATQGITDALEDTELLTSMIESAVDEETKKFLQSQMDESDKILKKYSGKGSGAAKPAVTQYGPNAPIAHDDNAFPDINDAKWQDALNHYGSSSYGWKSAGGGSTCPHKIDFNGKTYFVKQAGVNPTYSPKAAMNEANANNFMRLAGLNAPDSQYIEHNGESFCITTESDLSGGNLDSHLNDKKIAKQVKDAYPIMSLLYNMDIMQNSDNAFVDKNGNALFLDNGSTFGFSARGERNKRFNFDSRDDAKNGNPDFLALANFHGNQSGENWRKAIMGSSHKDVDWETALKDAAQYEMGALVDKAAKEGLLDHLPSQGRKALKKYADSLDKLSAKYKKPKVQPQPQSQPTVQQPTQASATSGKQATSSTATNTSSNSSTKPKHQYSQGTYVPSITKPSLRNPTQSTTNAPTQTSAIPAMAEKEMKYISNLSYAWDPQYDSQNGCITFGTQVFPSHSDPQGSAERIANNWGTFHPQSDYDASAVQNSSGQWEVKLTPKISNLGQKSAISTMPASTGTSNLSPSIQRSIASLQKRMSAPGLSAKQKQGIQQMINRMMGQNVQPQSTQQSVAQPQPQSQSQTSTNVSQQPVAPTNSTISAQPAAPTPAAPTPVSPTQMNASTKNPKHTAAVAALQKRLNAPGLSPAQKTAIQAMINRFV